MSTIRFVDNKTGEELALCSEIEIDTDRLTDVTQFGSMGTQYMATSVDVEVRVREFKTRMAPVPDMSAQREIAELNKVICALVAMMGGAVSIGETELLDSQVGNLIVEQRKSPGGIILRLDQG